MNIATFAGHVGQDAKLQTTAGGKVVATFSIAIDNGKTSDGTKRDPTWIRCTLWEKKAEALAKHITKGKMVVVSGPIDVECWISRQGGEAQAAIVCIVREFTFCGGGEKPEDSKKAA